MYAADYDCPKCGRVLARDPGLSDADNSVRNRMWQQGHDMTCPRKGYPR